MSNKIIESVYGVQMSFVYILSDQADVVFYVIAALHPEWLL